MQPDVLNDEHKFSIVCFNHQVDQMSEEQAKQVLKHLHEQFIIQRLHYNELLKHQWGIE